jgi:hypothetical protein
MFAVIMGGWEKALSFQQMRKPTGFARICGASKEEINWKKEPEASDSPGAA